jgi:hypothetical protein
MTNDGVPILQEGACGDVLLLVTFQARKADLGDYGVIKEDKP